MWQKRDAETTTEAGGKAATTLTATLPKPRKFALSVTARQPTLSETMPFTTRNYAIYAC